MFAVDRTETVLTEEEFSILKHEAKVLIAEGVPAKSGRLLELFEFLVQRTLEQQPPKEAEIASIVFQREISSDGDDSSVRVYIHRLRKKLEEYYLRNPERSDVRITLPRGGYQLVVTQRSGTEERLARRESFLGQSLRSLSLSSKILIGGLLALNLVALAVFGFLSSSQSSQNLPGVWSSLSERERPLVVVLGDYYIFGEFKDGLFLERLVREFDVNSAEDLVAKIESDPSLKERYVDISLEYLPVSVAYALDDLSPLLRTKTTRILQASELDPEAMKCCDLLYIGLTSGLGLLENSLLRQGPFRLGDTYDEIIDTNSDQKYVSEAFLAAPGETVYRDYGVLNVTESPAGNHVWAIMGTRDTGLSGLTEWLMSPEANSLRAAPGSSVLFEITGQKNLNLSAKVLAKTGP